MWNAYGEKVRGYTHTLKNSPCQDAFEIRRDNGYVIAAVADGHGSTSCPYSEEGANTAVTLCADIMEEAVKSCLKNDGFSVMKQNMELYIPKKIDYMWKTRVKELHEASGRGDAEDIYMLYGTTLLCLVATERFYCALQLGDGDILAVEDSGETAWVIEPKELSGSETESLCQKDSWGNMRVFFSRLFTASISDCSQEGTEARPRMFLLATDGYNNSYADASEFLRIGRDYLANIRENGFDYIKTGLSDWISETSKGGSGDDITLVIISGEV